MAKKPSTKTSAASAPDSDESIHAGQDEQGAEGEEQLYMLYRTEPHLHPKFAPTCTVPASEVDNYVNSGHWTTEEPAGE